MNPKPEFFNRILLLFLLLLLCVCKGWGVGELQNAEIFDIGAYQRRSPCQGTTTLAPCARLRDGGAVNAGVSSC